VVTTLNSKLSTPNAFIWPVRVYYEDTDAGGVVYYANYLKFMERARTEWLRSLGFEQTTLSHEHNLVFVVRALAIEFLRPALFNDLLEAMVELIDVHGSLIEVAQTIRRGTLTLVSAEVKLACVNTQSFKPVRIPQPILEKIAMRQA
jgi:acyl-CoA thioester hydrolase